MKQVDYQKVQLCVLAMLILYGVALMLGVQVPAANVKGVDRIVDLLVLLLSAQHLAGRIQTTNDQPVPVGPGVQDLINFQKAVQGVAAAVNRPATDK